MTTENARKAGELAARLQEIHNAIYKAEKLGQITINRHCADVTVKVDNDFISGVPKEIAKEAIDLIANRLSEEYKKIEAEIKAM